MDKKVLIVKHLPKAFTKELCEGFFNEFGACNVHFMGSKGRMKYCAFVEFNNETDAKGALSKLHQLSFLNTTLVAEFSQNIPRTLKHTVVRNNLPEESDSIIIKNRLEKEKEKLKHQVAKDINAISHNLNFEYSINPNLFYSYPKATMSILLNIVNALASVPKFYSQVLHLMNKMNLPAPFGRVTLTPPLVDDIKNLEEVVSSEESEYDSSTEINANTDVYTRKRKRVKVKIDDLTKKKIKLQMMMEAQLQNLTANKTTTVVQNVKDVFEDTSCSEKSKKIDIKITKNFEKTITPTFVDDSVSSIPEPCSQIENSGFGKILPETKEPEKLPNEEEHEWSKEEFITLSELEANRLPLSEYKNVNAFKNYRVGEVSSRLYLKNLSRGITEAHLHHLFGKFVEWDKELEVGMYDIRLMKEGRMKGQAFVSLPSEKHAQLALKEVNGYLLQGKPLAIHFARSAKLKTP